MTTRRKLAASVAAGAAFVAALVGPVASPAEAQVADPTAVLTGNFSGGPEEEAFVYRAGAGADVLVRFSNGGVSGGPVTWATFPHPVSGQYRPVAGDFLPGGYDDILWHAPGTAPDYLWSFSSDTVHTSREYAVNGSFTPVAGNFHPAGAEDVLWYGSGAARDYMWSFNADGTYVSADYTVRGEDYRPVAGTFVGVDGTSDVFWHAPGPAPDYLWQFSGVNHSFLSSEWEVNGTYEPFRLDVFSDGPNGEDIFFHASGEAPDYVWDFLVDERNSFGQPMGGDYVAAAGRLLTADGCADILWHGAGDARLWDYRCGGIDRYEYGLPPLPTGGAAAAAPVTAEAIPGASVTRER